MQRSRVTALTLTAACAAAAAAVALPALTATRPSTSPAAPGFRKGAARVAVHEWRKPPVSWESMLAHAVAACARRRAATCARRAFSQSAPRSPPPPPPRPDVTAAATNQGLYICALVVGMVGATYGAVPLYRLFCQATGFGGTVREGATVEAKLAARSRVATPTTRPITITFNADVADGLHWRFTPAQRAVTVRPGQSALAFFTATNMTQRPITGVSTYNVTPQHAAPYFNKVQCFCFEEQRLLPGESVDMPVLFYVDPEFETDKRLTGLDTLTLSYTFFLVDDGTLPEAEVASRRAAAVAAREEEERVVAELAARREGK